MTAYTITCPAENFSGDVAGVYFRDSRATIVNDTDPGMRAALAYFLRRGYTVTAAEPKQADDGSDDASTARPKDYAPKPEWVAYAVSLGADPAQADAMTKNDLVDHYGKTSNEEDNS